MLRSRSALAMSAIVALALSAAACGRQTATTPTTSSGATTESETASTSTPDAPQLPALAPVSTPDFLQRVALSDMFEIQAGQLATQRAKSAAIKSFAQQMVTDHRGSSNNLKAAMKGQTGLPALPTALDDEHQRMLADLRGADANDFDQKYVDNQTSAHQKTLDVLQNYAQSGDNTGLKAFATQTAPVVQHHLDMVKQLDKSGADEPSQGKTQ